MWSGMCRFCTNHVFIKLSFLEDVLDMPWNDSSVPFKKDGHLLFAEPHSLIFEFDIYRSSAVGSLVEDYFAPADIWIHIFRIFVLDDWIARHNRSCTGPWQSGRIALGLYGTWFVLRNIKGFGRVDASWCNGILHQGLRCAKMRYWDCAPVHPAGKIPARARMHYVMVRGWSNCIISQVQEPAPMRWSGTLST